MPKCDFNKVALQLNHNTISVQKLFTSSVLLALDFLNRNTRLNKTYYAE